MEKNKKILYQPFEGLGDHLQFSTIPEQLSNAGYDVYLSETVKFKNHQIYKLIYEHNPFIKGISSEAPNCGVLNNNWGYEGKEHINRMEAICGAPESSIALPKIYYKPNFLKEFAGKTVVLLEHDSTNYTYDQTLFIVSQTEPDAIFLKTGRGKQMFDVKEDFLVQVENIFHLTDIIYSCKHFICLFSGPSVLASAVKYNNDGPEITCYVPGYMRTYHETEKGYNFFNINYIYV